MDVMILYYGTLKIKSERHGEKKGERITLILQKSALDLIQEIAVVALSFMTSPNCPVSVSLPFPPGICVHSMYKTDPDPIPL